MKPKTMRIMQHASIIFITIVIHSSIFSLNSTSSNATSEEVSALLKWKFSLDEQSQSLLSSWETINPSNHCRSWLGISCNKANRVDNITIQNRGLKGMLSDLNFSSLHHLTIINLDNNSLYGTIPSQIGNLERLAILSLSINSLSGIIPSTLCQLAGLKYFYLSKNKFSGIIPKEIGLLSSVTELSFADNNLSGSIPSSISNLSSLTKLNLNRNQLIGTIPREIGRLTSLTDIWLSENNLSGVIPNSIGNLSNLGYLILTLNQFSGTIPLEIGLLKSLASLSLFGNNMSGLIPTSLNNLTNLEEFAISENRFTGQLPDNICRGGYLRLLTAYKNNITGHVPKTLKTCFSLQRLRLDTNRITGNVSTDFGEYPHLSFIDLSNNNFYGELSQNWESCTNLSAFKISNNNVSGRIPTEIGRLPKLEKLDLSSNHLTGDVPRNLTEILSDINLSNNDLSGNVPPEIGDLHSLQTLNLAGNNLNGLFPMQLAECVNLRVLNLSKNRLDGVIPIEISKFHVLETLDLADNLLFGEIPPEFGQLIALQNLNLSHNQFTGSIPHSFNQMTSLININLSYNRLEGPIPDVDAFHQASFDFRENKNLCGNFDGVKECHAEVKTGEKKKKSEATLILIVACILSFLLLISVISGFLLCRRNQRKAKPDKIEENNGNLFSIWSYDGKLVYDNIIKETENFDEKYFIGAGGSGGVYKVEQPDGQVFAVKKLHTTEHGELNDQKAFTSEIRALAEIRHRNIVKLYGFCSHFRHSFLVYEFFEGGDLHKILSDEKKATVLDWTLRIDIIKGVTNGLSYMHHDCSPPVVHRDISSKNILLDNDYVAHISDFGTARILKADSSNYTSFAGTFGYAAPELAHTMEVNEMQDVFSFGVLILEVIMGKHPGDLVSQLSSSMILPDKFRSTLLKDVFDPRLPIPTTISETEEIVCSLKLAFACLQFVPHHRPTMKQVSTELSKQKPPLQNSIFTMTLGNLVDGPDYLAL